MGTGKSTYYTFNAQVRKPTLSNRRKWKDLSVNNSAFGIWYHFVVTELNIISIIVDCCIDKFMPTLD